MGFHFSFVFDGKKPSKMVKKDYLRIPTIPATHSERRRPGVGAERRWA